MWTKIKRNRGAAIGVSVCLVLLVAYNALKISKNEEKTISHRKSALGTAQNNDPVPYNPVRQITKTGPKDVDGESLARMTLGEISELYHRYVSTLQFFCPRKDMLGGIAWGWYVCPGFSTNKDCLIYIITDEKEEDAYLTYDIDKVYNCTREKILAGAIRNELLHSDAGTPLTNALVQKERVDILLIEGDGSDDIVTGLLRNNALRHVSQLSVVFNAVNSMTPVSGYAKQILPLKALYDEGFRIFNFERDPTHVFKNNRWQTGCYTLNMMRDREVDKPMVIPSPKEMANMTHAQLASTYLSFMLTTEVLCKEIRRVGNIGDGGWDVCVDDRYRPEKPCLVYSFGINNDWTFDERIISLFGCEVHSFDPSMGMSDHKRSEKHWFHNIGLSNKSGTITMKGKTWNMLDFKSIRSSLGHSKRQIDVLKIDIETSEFLALPNMLESGDLKYVKQLHLEVHPSTNRAPISSLIEYFTILWGLHDQGFRLFWSHPNQVKGSIEISKYTKRYVSQYYELYYVNINL